MSSKKKKIEIKYKKKYFNFSLFDDFSGLFLYIYLLSKKEKNCGVKIIREWGKRGF